jgi:hypothetical protein
MEDVEDHVGGVRGKGTFSFEHIMDVGLGDAGDASQVSFSEFAAANALAEVFEKPPLEFMKIHPVLTLFLTAIGQIHAISIR